MIRFSLGIPIAIRPGFWILAAVIGFLYSHNFIGTLIWMVIIFVSVLFHEFGHALTAKFFKRNPRIELMFLGGVTYHDGQSLSLGRQFFITLNGPLFGFILFGIAYFLLKIPALQSGLLGASLAIMRMINLFWTVINLLPVMPLDGGQLLRIGMEAVFKEKGFKYTQIASLAISLALAILFFFLNYLLVGAIFFLFAFQAFETYRQARFMTGHDKNEKMQAQLSDAENALHEGKTEEAQKLFERIRNETKKGMIFLVATQYLALIYREQGHFDKVYEVLKPVRAQLASDALAFLHEAAFHEKDYALVIEISGSCYQVTKGVDIALRSACAAALLSRTEMAIGWLKAALKEGLDNLPEITRDPSFDPIRTDPAFTEFLKKPH
jgi:stage IV sporulation protein FB